MVQVRRKFRIFLTLLVGSITQPVSAVVVTINGVGAVSTQSAGGGGTVNALGQQAAASITYDPADLLLIGGSAVASVYRINSAAFTASIGTHTLAFDPSAGGQAELFFQTGFAFFGGPTSEAVLMQTFRFTGTGGETSPVTFAGLPPTRDIFTFTSTFRTGLATLPASIASFRDPGVADRGGFFYAATTSDPRQFGTGSGSFDAIQLAAPSVPEPSTWAMLILGFGSVGFTLRRRRRMAPAWRDQKLLGL